MSNNHKIIAPETKNYSGDVGDAFDEFKGTFEQFRNANDERLSQIEKRMSADVITVEKVDRINAVVDEQKRYMENLLLKSKRPALGASQFTNIAQMEHKAGFTNYSLTPLK